MQFFIILLVGLITLTLNSPVMAVNCDVDDAGVCVDGECRLTTGEIGVCTTSVDGLCECVSISD